MDVYQLVQIKCPLGCVMMFVDTLKKFDINELIDSETTLGTQIALHQPYEVIIQVDHLIGFDYKRGDYISSFTSNTLLTSRQKEKMCTRAIENSHPKTHSTEGE